MAINVNMDGIDDSGGWLKTGTYYARCVKVEEMKGTHGDAGLELTWEALWPEEAVGKTTRDRIWAAGRAAPRLKLCARACGLRTSGQNVSLGAADFVGKVLWVQVEEGKPYERDGVMKQSWQVGWDGYDGMRAAPPGIAPAAAPVPGSAIGTTPDDDDSVPF